MENLNEQWYALHTPEELDTPALLVYRDRVRKNIDALVKSIDQPSRLRPHIKTCKSQDAAMLMMAAGIKKFKCATIAEAEMLAQAGAPDILLAYQPVGPKIHRLVQLVKKYAHLKFSCLIDNPGTLQQLSNAAVDEGLEIDIYIDLNVGMNRTGIAPGKAAFDLYMQAFHAEGVNPVGLHAYDGHLHTGTPEERTARCDAAFEPVFLLQQELVHAGRQPEIVAGGSPTFPIHAKRGGVDCSPGTFVYWDKGYSDKLQEQPFEPAALVMTRVISLPAPGRICVDLGHKSIASENELTRRVAFINAPELVPVGHSEEHMVLQAGDDHTWKVGDVLYGIPYHICPTVALYQFANVVIDHTIYGKWITTARDRKLSI